MRFRVIRKISPPRPRGGEAPVSSLAAASSPAADARRAALENPYSRYYTTPRTPEDLLAGKKGKAGR
jgi:hypothetical protein